MNLDEVRARPAEVAAEIAGETDPDTRE